MEALFEGAKSCLIVTKNVEERKGPGNLTIGPHHLVDSPQGQREESNCPFQKRDLATFQISLLTNS